LQHIPFRKPKPAVAEAAAVVVVAVVAADLAAADQAA
jgi:hypothetical protein